MHNPFSLSLFNMYFMQAFGRLAGRCRPMGTLGAALGVILSLMVILGGTAQAAITARITMTTYPEFASQNAPPGHITFMRASIPNAGNNYDASVAWQDITGNVTNLAVNLGTTPGYFTMGFNDNSYMSAASCTSNVNFSTSSAYMTDGGSFDVLITCTVPDTTPPTPRAPPPMPRAPRSPSPLTRASRPVTGGLPRPTSPSPSIPRRSLSAA